MQFPRHVGLLHPVGDPVRLPWPQGGAGEEVRDQEGAEEGGHEGEENTEEHFHGWCFFRSWCMQLDDGSGLCLEVRMFLGYSVSACRRKKKHQCFFC